MAANHIFSSVILCFSVIYCKAWILKRQSSSECESRTDPCLMNAKVIMDLFYGKGFDRLVVNNQFALQCSASVRQDTDRCARDNADCIASFMVNRLMTAYRYMCDNEEVFVYASSCWNSRSIANTVMKCEDDSDASSHCSMSRCLQREIPKIYGCTPQAASVFTNMVQAVLQSSCR